MGKSLYFKMAGLCGSSFYHLLFILIFLAVPILSADAQEPIKIGAGLSLSGKYEEPGNMIKKGYQVWAQETNRNGGLLGRPVELHIIDDRSSIGEARRIYRHLIEEEQVDLLLAPYGTPITLAVSEITESAGYVLVSGGASGTEIWDRGYKYVFGVYSTADRFFIGFIDLIARKGIQNVTILHEDNPFNNEAALGAVEWAEKMGVSVDQWVGYNPDITSPAQLLKGVSFSDDEALILCTYPEEGYAFLQALSTKEQQPSAICMTITPIHPLFSYKAGAMAEGVFGPSQWEPEERIPYPGTREFIRAFRNFTQMTPSYHAGSAYAAGQVLSRAIEATQGLDHSKLRDYITAMDTVTVIGRFKVDMYGKQIGHNTLLIQWQNGKKEVVYPLSMHTAKPRFPVK